jgi:hypothetical protein
MNDITLEFGPTNELQQIGQGILSGGISIASALTKYIPERCEILEIRKHPYLQGKALISNGSDAGVVDTDGMNMPDYNWSVSIYEQSGHLPLALKNQVPGSEMFVSLPLEIFARFSRIDQNGNLIPMQVAVMEDTKTRQWARSIMQDTLNKPNGVKNAEIPVVRQAADLVQSVINLVQHKPIEAIKHL